MALKLRAEWKQNNLTLRLATARNFQIRTKFLVYYILQLIK